MAEGVTSTAGLKKHYGEPSSRAVNKQLDALDEHCRHFIAHSPFLVMGTSDADGRVDVSPKGDPAGFVSVLDAQRLLVPDRPGNNRLDSLGNLLENPRVGLIFFIPGINETLRVNGRASICEDPALLQPLAVRGKIPKTAVLVLVEEAYLHCPKALVRSGLWDAQRQVKPGTIPSMAKMLSDQIEGLELEEAQRHSEQSLRDRLY